MDTFTASDGVRLAYFVDDFTDPWKKPPVLLLLHAAMGSSRRFYAWVPRLCRHYRVVRIDLRGHGASEVPSAEAPLSLERLVLDVAELLDHQGIASAHIVGNSAGGYLAQRLAMTRPERVSSLMLFASTPGLKRSQAPSWIPEIEAKGLRAFLAETIAQRFPVGEVDSGLISWFLDEAAKNDPSYIARFVLLMASYDWSEELDRIRCPTLVVVPGAEPIGGIANYEPFARLVPDVEMRVFEGAPHNICDAFPERCVEEVEAFLRRRFRL
jgi:3-oxoadipate enol-lactonase